MDFKYTFSNLVIFRELENGDTGRMQLSDWLVSKLRPLVEYKPIKNIWHQEKKL